MDYNKLSWKKKILVQLNKANGDAMSTSEIVKALKKDHDGVWKSPSVPTLLYHMEKDGSIKIDRSVGRNLHLLNPGWESVLEAKPGPTAMSPDDRKEVRLCLLFSRNEINELGGEQAIVNRMTRAAYQPNA